MNEMEAAALRMKLAKKSVDEKMAVQRLADDRLAQARAAWDEARQIYDAASQAWYEAL